MTLADVVPLVVLQSRFRFLVRSRNFLVASPLSPSRPSRSSPTSAKLWYNHLNCNESNSDENNSILFAVRAGQI
jgi:hypothetical protein